jgi:glycosyltransferase involved in cell wall biosynthesis
MHQGDPQSRHARTVAAECSVVTPLTVAVDGRALGDASAQRGLGTYLRMLLEGLGRHPEVEARVLVSDAAVVPEGVVRRPSPRRAPARWSTLEHHLRLPGELARLGCDLVHSPALDPPAFVRGPWVQTVADLLPLEWADPSLAAERRRWRRWAGRIRRAGAVITFSGHGAGQVQRHLGVDPDRIHVVPLAAGPQFRPGPGLGEDAAPYVLYVGEYGPHKGFAEAAGVAAALAERGLPHRLKMAGTLAPWHRPAVEAALTRGGAHWRGGIDLCGWVPDLASLYRGAGALIATSRHEGFCLPAVEAMACGTPVVAFANSALPEVVGRGGTLVPDGDVATMAQAVAALLEEPERRQEMAAAALHRAAAFSWDRTVAQHVEIYRAAAGATGS